MEKRILSTLKHSGYKLTPARRLVVRMISESREHLTPAAIFERAKATHTAISLVTVYRTLELLTNLGFICQVHGEGGCHSYLLRHPAEHHHHLICSGCGTVTDFTDCDISALEERLSRKTGFKIDNHLLELVGLCPACQKGEAR